LETLYDQLIDILSKKAPVEGVQVKVDQIINKIRLVPIPDDIVPEDETRTVEKTTEDGEVTQT